MNTTHEKILSFLSSVGEATQQEMVSELGINKGTISRTLKELQDRDLIKVVRTEGRTKYYALAKPFNTCSNESANHITLSNVSTIAELRGEINKVLNKFNWSSTFYNVPLSALLISRYTNLRVIIFGSQACGKTSCITAVYPDAINNPNILFDMHRKNLYDYVNMVKDNVKVIEQQYRHNWSMEDCKGFDRFEVVPISKIAPSEFIFRFLPLRIKQPLKVKPGFQHFTIDLGEFKPVKTIPDELQEMFLKQLESLRYFTIDVATCKAYLEMLKEKEVSNLYYVDRDGNPDPQISAKQWRIEKEYDVILKNNFSLVNYYKLRSVPELWFPVTNDLQLMLNAFEILRFSYSLNRNPELAAEDAAIFLSKILSTFTRVVWINIEKKEKKAKHSIRNVETHGTISVPVIGDRYVIPASNLEFG